MSHGKGAWPVAVVTGASRGIGRAIAVQLSKAGYRVVAAARNMADLEHTVALMDREDATHWAAAVDVRDEGQVVDLFKRVQQRYGRVDVLVNNAGFVDPVGLLEMSLDNWNETIAVNLTGAFLCSREFVRMNKRVGGKIVNVASTAGMSARPGWSAYAASKAGLINLSLTMSEELKPYSIRVYCIAPGRTATTLRTKLAPGEDQSTILQPGAVARLVEFVVSADGDFLDQQTIVIRKPIE